MTEVPLNVCLAICSYTICSLQVVHTGRWLRQVIESVMYLKIPCIQQVTGGNSWEVLHARLLYLSVHSMSVTCVIS